MTREIWYPRLGGIRIEWRQRSRHNPDVVRYGVVLLAPATTDISADGTPIAGITIRANKFLRKKHIEIQLGRASTVIGETVFT